MTEEPTQNNQSDFHLDPPEGKQTGTNEAAGSTRAARPDQAAGSSEAVGTTRPARPDQAAGSSEAVGSTRPARPEEAAGSSEAAGSTRPARPEEAAGSSEAAGSTRAARPEEAAGSSEAAGSRHPARPDQAAGSSEAAGRGEAAGLTGFLKAWADIFKSRGTIVIVGFVIGALFLFLTMQKIEWAKVYDAFRSGHWLPWLPLAVLTYIIGMLLRGYRLKLLVQGEASVSVGTASNIVAVGYATNNILPARLGEFARAAMLAERTGLPYLLSLTVTFLERLLDGLVILFLFVAGSLIVPVDATMRTYSFFAALIFLMAIISVAFITLTPQTTVAIISNLTAPLSRKWHGKAVGLVAQINRGFGCLRNARNALLILLSSFCVWLVESAFFMLIMPCFGLPPGFIRGVITMSVTNLGILIPSTPGYVGPYHYICKDTLKAVCAVSGVTPGTLAAIQVDDNVALSYAVVVHLVFYLTVTIWGVLALARYSLELSETAAMAWEAKPIRRLPESHEEHWQGEPLSIITSFPDLSPRIVESVNKFWSGLCECFIPEEHILPDPEEHKRVLHETSVFTVTELERLPFRLRVLFEIAVTGFKTIILLTSGRFLCHIPIDERRRIVRGWAFGGISLTRKFMKPIRSLALFAYYENQEVQHLLDTKRSKGETTALFAEHRRKLSTTESAPAIDVENRTATEPVTIVEAGSESVSVLIADEATAKDSSSVVMADEATPREISSALSTDQPTSPKENS